MRPIQRVNSTTMNMVNETNQVIINLSDRISELEKLQKYNREIIHTMINQMEKRFEESNKSITQNCKKLKEMVETNTQVLEKVHQILLEVAKTINKLVS